MSFSECRNLLIVMLNVVAPLEAHIGYPRQGVGSWPYLQALEQAGKAWTGQTLKLTQAIIRVFSCKTPLSLM